MVAPLGDSGRKPPSSTWYDLVVFTLRCTAKLLRRLRAAPIAATAAPTTTLGDWYANLLYEPGGQVLGSMTDFAWMLTADRGEGRSLIERSIQLAHAPCGPIGMRSPEDVAPALLRGALPPHLRAVR